MLMTMTRRIQIPIEEPDLALVRAAALQARRPLAEWARGVLRDEARQRLGESRLEPTRALEQLFGAEAPVTDVESMTEQSVAGRLR